MTHEDFTLDTSSPERASLDGVLRLASPQAYEERFAPLRSSVERCPSAYTIDISKVRFINSSGITGLSRIVLLVRGLDRGLVLVGRRAVPWQETTLRLFQRLYPRVDVQLS